MVKFDDLNEDEEKQTRKDMTNDQIKEEDKLDKAWSFKIRQAWDFHCAIGGVCKGNLNAHHIIPRENRKFRHDENNGICLCWLHHKRSLEISPHRNAFMFFKWMMKYHADQLNYLLEKSTNDFS
jgi:hypothetical protein